MTQDAAAALEACRPILLVVDAGSAQYATLTAHCTSLRNVVSLGEIRYSRSFTTQRPPQP